MDDKFTTLTPQLYAYLLAHNPPRDAVLADLAAETAKLGGWSLMQIAHEQGVFLTLLARLLGARRIVEVGTFTGYSAICLARGLAPGGRLLCCDVNEEWTGIARRYFERAGLAERIELRIAPALDTLRALPERPEIDLVFIDADKPNYRAYYETLLPRLRPGGLVVFDNVLWMGEVANPANQEESTAAIRALNDHLVRDERVDTVMLPVADGVTLARKRDAA
jgi:caffeoyl-CoA O-methyltransferase